MQLNINERRARKKIKEWKWEAEIYINKMKQTYVYTMIPLYYFL